jgi:hypothetical protein
VSAWSITQSSSSGARVLKETIMKKSTEFSTRMLAEIAWGDDLDGNADRDARRARWERRKAKKDPR